MILNDRTWWFLWIVCKSSDIRRVTRTSHQPEIHCKNDFVLFFQSGLVCSSVSKYLMYYPTPPKRFCQKILKNCAFGFWKRLKEDLNLWKSRVLKHFIVRRNVFNTAQVTAYKLDIPAGARWWVSPGSARWCTTVICSPVYQYFLSHM